jgi:hypothetical protein
LLRAARSFADRNSHGARDVYLRALRVAVQAGGFNGSPRRPPPPPLRGSDLERSEPRMSSAKRSPGG